MDGGVVVKGSMKIVVIIFVAVNVLYDSRMCAILFILQRTSVSNILRILCK